MANEVASGVCGAGLGDRCCVEGQLGKGGERRGRRDAGKGEERMEGKLGVKMNRDRSVTEGGEGVD